MPRARSKLVTVGQIAAERILWARVGAQRWLERDSRHPLPMTVPATAVLRSESEWRAAVAECRRLRLPLHRTREKNWDALGAVGAVLRQVGTEASVLDAGAARYSTVLPWLRLYGLSRLRGINLDFDQDVRHGPVQFCHGDITRTGLPDAELDAVTCMSVIEHGVDVRAFLHEAARVLRPGGLLCVSTDYDQQPPDTSGRFAYGHPVRIFGPADIHSLVTEAEARGFRLLGDLQLQHPERPVHWKRMGLRYTFILLSFVRRRRISVD